MGGIVERVLLYLMQNLRVLRDAPIVFAAVFVLGLVSGYYAASYHFQGTISEQAAAIEELNAQIQGLSSRLDVLRRRATESGASPAPTSRDPDGIYQLGARVGKIQIADVEESRGVVLFGAIIEAENLNPSKTFQYRAFVLRIKSYGAVGGASIAGQMTKMYQQVTCEIVGRVGQ